VDAAATPSSAKRIRRTQPTVVDPEGAARRAVDVLATHVASTDESDRHGAGDGTEEPATQARSLRRVATSTSGLTATGRAAPAPPTGSVVAGRAVTPPRKRVAALPVRRVVWLDVEVGDAGCRHALRRLATCCHSGACRAFHAGGSAQDECRSRESELELCFESALPFDEGQRGLGGPAQHVGSTPGA